MVGFGDVYVGIAKLALAITEAHSLKEKRMVLRRIKDRVRERLQVTMNEVGEQDIWQRAELGCAVVSADRGKALELIDEVVRVAMSAGGAEVTSIAKEVQTFDAPGEPVADKASAADDFVVPEEWKQ